MLENEISFSKILYEKYANYSIWIYEIMWVIWIIHTAFSYRIQLYSIYSENRRVCVPYAFASYTILLMVIVKIW